MKDLLNIFRDKSKGKQVIMNQLRPDLDLSIDSDEAYLRYGTVEDIPSIIQLEQDAYNGYLAWQAKDFKYDWDHNPYGLYLILEEKDSLHEPPKIIGMINGRFRQKGGHISHVIVDPKFQGKGYGKILIQKFIDASELLKNPRIVLEVRASNYKAQQLYANFGFEQRNIKHFYYSDNYEDAIEMVLEK